MRFLPCLLEALGQMYPERKQCCHVVRGALRAVEETVDDNVLTLAGLSSDTSKEKHLTIKSDCRRKLCEDHKKALTCEHLTQSMGCPERLHSLSVSRDRPHAMRATLLAF